MKAWETNAHTDCYRQEGKVEMANRTAAEIAAEITQLKADVEAGKLSEVAVRPRGRRS